MTPHPVAVCHHALRLCPQLTKGDACREVWPEMLAYINKHHAAGALPVLVAHNGSRFDNKMLAAECERIGDHVPGEPAQMKS